METFTELKDFVPNPGYDRQRREALDRLEIEAIDAPLVALIRDLNKLPSCFSLQCCYGHFLYSGQQDLSHIGRLPLGVALQEVEYRIAYLAVCLQDNIEGRALLQELSELSNVDAKYVQFGCAEWFWERQVNSYVVQVEPELYENEDRALVSYQEALHIERVRDEFFERLGVLVGRKLQADPLR